MSLPRPQGSTTSKLLRRAWLIPGVVLAAVAVVGLFPLLLVIALIVDVVFRRWKLTTVRILLVAVAYLIVCVVVQVWGLMVWIMTGFGRTIFTEHGQRMVNPTIEMWIRVMLRILRLIGLRIRYDQIDPSVFAGRVIVASRHESLADVYVPTWLAALGGHRLRVVLAAGLNREPSLDLFGHWSPQFFVRREASDMRSEVVALKRLTEASDENTAFVIFPEGGLVREKRRERILKRLDSERPDLAERARALRHLLAPRIAGTSALLDGAEDAAVVIVGHSGMDQLTDPVTCWRSIPLQRDVDLKVWRFERSEIPDSLAERELWLFDRWAEMDDWIESKMPGAH
ncbi:MAG: 1-acyl-sn-glycerol-3-phosphate acyltransferase [Acidimicrobiales bacterium]